MTNLATVTSQYEHAGFILLGYVLINGGQLDVLDRRQYYWSDELLESRESSEKYGSCICRLVATNRSWRGKYEHFVAAIFWNNLRLPVGIWTNCDDCWVRSYYTSKSRSCNAWGLNLTNNGFAGGFVASGNKITFWNFEGYSSRYKRRKAEDTATEKAIFVKRIRRKWSIIICTMNKM